MSASLPGLDEHHSALAVALEAEDSFKVAARMELSAARLCGYDTDLRRARAAVYYRNAVDWAIKGDDGQLAEEALMEWQMHLRGERSDERRRLRRQLRAAQVAPAQ